MRRSVRRDDIEVVLDAGSRPEVATQQFKSARHRVHVRILESGDQQASREIDDLGVGSHEGLHIGIRPDRHDLSVTHGDGARA